MLDPRFEALRESLLRAGIAARHAQRAALEMQSHFQQLLNQSLASGTARDAAQIEAHATLGSDAHLLQEFVNRRELRSFASRHAGLYFSLLPLLCFMLLGVAVVAGAASCTDFLRARIPHGLSADIELGMRIAILWVAPIVISAIFGLLAYRQRVSFRWPVLGVIILCTFASLLNIDWVLWEGDKPGYIGAGIGVSTHALFTRIAQVAARTALVLIPLGLATLRLRRRLAT